MTGPSRFRLLLLMLAVLVPATAAAWFMVAWQPERVLLPLVAGALLLLALATGTALWVARTIADAADSHKRSAQDLHDLQRLATLGRLTGSVAHDLNNLLGAISNSAHLIARHAVQTPALQMPLDVTRRAVEAGSQLSQQLLRLSVRQPVVPHPVDLAVWLPALRDLLQLVVGKTVTVQIAVAPGTPPVTIDPGALELALIHLALNAREAMPRGGQLRVQACRAGTADTDGRAGPADAFDSVSRWPES